jgi:very-short-patch-repair endonuclease
MEDIRRKLLDLTRANRLLNHKVNGARTLEIVDEVCAEVYRLVVEEGKSMHFLSREEAPGKLAEALARREEEGGEGEGRTWELPPDVAEADAARHTDRKLQTALPGEKLQKRLLAMARDAKASIDEQGCNTLYLTLGMVEWRMPGEAEVGSRAPVLFVPVQLERKNAGSRYTVALFEDEILTNPCLVELARQDFGFALPAFEEESEEGVAGYFERIAAEVGKVKGWAFRPEIHLGIFSFAKLLMWRDLDDRHWPEEKKITQHTLIRRLRGAAGETPPAGREKLTAEGLDERLKPADCFHVMDADSSQQVVIEAVRGGADLVVEGPPGTGKSQTITNIIAECVASEKTVLFVAEKAAALDVVKRRLEQSGLGDAVLALHSKNTHKGTVMGELRRVLEREPERKSAAGGDAGPLLTLRERLRAYRDQVHKPVGALEMSVFAAVGEALRWSAEPEAPCPIGDALTWSRAQVDAVMEQLNTLGRRLAEAGPRNAHPWRAARLTSVSLNVRQTLPGLGQSVLTALEHLRQLGEQLAALLRAVPPASPAETQEQANMARALLDCPVMDAANFATLDAAMRKKLQDWLDGFDRHAAEKGAWSKTLQDAAEEMPWQPWLERRQKGGGLFAFLSRQWRADTATFRGQLRARGKPPREEELRLIRAVITSAGTRAQLTRTGDELSGLLGGAWQGWASDRDGVARAARGAMAVTALLADGKVNREAASALVTGDRAPLRNLAAALAEAGGRVLAAWNEFLRTCDAEDAGWFAQGLSRSTFVDAGASIGAALRGLDRLTTWADLNAALAAARGGKGRAFADWGYASQGDPGRLGGAFARQFYRAWLELALAGLPAVRDWRGDDYPELARRFRELDHAWIASTRERVRALLESRRPDIAERTARQSELGVIKAELRKKRKFMPLRKLLAAAGPTIQTIKPCFMMSPISVAQYLTPGAIGFDVVIFDEASQVEPADAFGAIGRGRQLVLVGDEKQLPPTNFFARMEGEESPEEEESAADLESILGLGAARLGRSTQLRWHYRSRHASLIQFSNEKFYDGVLRVFPSPHTDRSELGLRFQFVEGGIYKRGTGRFNEVEARAVAAAVLDHARRFPAQSLGVGTLNRPQADAIMDELETLRRLPQNESLEAFFHDARHEPFFVKNLENIQGDEREVMFLSVGYGHDAAHRITGNFGALNGAGGWRRLNVFATRARRRCVIYASIRADDIRLGPGAPRGVAALKEYLHMAETGTLVAAPQPLKDHDSPFEADVCRALRDKGWEVHAQVGSAGFFVDLAVVDPRRPGRYLLGVECDGEVYHRAPTTRDRDRLRQEVLEGLGWSIHRIWSGDWYQRRDKALARLEARLGELHTPPG